MADHLPLLVFPKAKTIAPPKGKSVPPSALHFPEHARQVERLSQQMDELQQDFSRYKASVSGVVAGLEPETVLVIEIAGSVDKFTQAVNATEGLEWLGERDVEDIEPDDDFYEAPKIGVDFFKNKIDSITNGAQSKEIREILKKHGFIDDDGNIIADEIPELSLPVHLVHLSTDIIQAVNSAKDKLLKGRLFLSLSNEQGLRELLTLWEHWKKGEGLPQGKAKWRDVFDQTLRIRRWGIEETLRETGMIDRWHDLLDPINPAQEVYCQIELFYRRTPEDRKRHEVTIAALLAEMGGQTHGPAPFTDKPSIAFHAVKAKLPADKVRHLLEVLESPTAEVDIHLFKFPGVMYFRPTGQSMVISDGEAGEAAEFPEGSPELPPVVAILDGVPNLQHEALKDRLLFDDPDNLEAEYRLGEKKHGTSMASLVVHGEWAEGQDNSLSRKVYHFAVMQPDPHDRTREHIPDTIFFEDRIERAVLRMLKGEGNTPPQAPDVKIINLSIGDPERPFIHTPSPWARLLDWLSWKYRVLFCVSAGNYVDDIDVGIRHSEFSVLTDEQKIACVLKCIKQQLSQRRLLSPAESLNALTVGALHADESGDYLLGQRIDLLPSSALFSPVSRFGHGFRRSTKPEILFPAGRQLYNDFQVNGHHYQRHKSPHALGQKVANDSKQEGVLSEIAHTHGTSNATALATRSGARIYEVLSGLQARHEEQIHEDLMAVLIKALLVHGAQHPEQAKIHLTKALKSKNNSKRVNLKEAVARYMGYGAVDIERVLACTEQRATVLGCGEIRENEIHEYRFPLPVGLSEKNDWRRMVVTLAWFSRINPAHRNLREAKLELSPVGNWKGVPLGLERQDSDHHQVLRGTVQHEVLEGGSQIKVFQDGDDIRLQVICKKDATEKLDDAIPYGLAVTLEVAEGVDIPIYQQIRARIKPQVAVGAAVENI